MRGLALAALIATALLPAAARADTAPSGIHIEGDQFVDGTGKPVRLIGTTAGVGAADACVTPTYGDPIRIRSRSTFWAGYDDAALAAVRAWHMNTVRLTLNEQCWLGVNPVRNRAFSIVPVVGRARRSAAAALRRRYRAAMESFVTRAHRLGFIVIVDLHVSAPPNALAFAQYPLPDAALSPAFWRSVAMTFKDDHSLVFEVFNEPFDMHGRVTWKCLRDGCRLPNGAADSTTSGNANTRGCGALCVDFVHPRGSYQAVGMQRLVDVIRATGATQPLIVPGRVYTNDLSQWLAYAPHDPLGQLAANFHWYTAGPGNDGADECVNVDCWDRVIAPIAARVPVVTTEFGQFDCRDDLMNTYQDWADAHGVSYLAFGWYVADKPPCLDGSPSLITSYDGTPSPEGAGFKAHLEQLHEVGELP